MTLGRRSDPDILRRTALAGFACSGLACFGPSVPALARDGLWAYFEEERFLEPPLALPEQINGVIRRAQEPHAVASIDRITDVFMAVRSCWQPPADPSGQQITVRLSFKRNGEAISRPQITYAGRRSDREARQRLAGSVFAAFDRCTPLPFTAGFGSAIAGRPFTFRFVDDRPA